MREITSARGLEGVRGAESELPWSQALEEWVDFNPWRGRREPIGQKGQHDQGQRQEELKAQIYVQQDAGKPS